MAEQIPERFHAYLLKGRWSAGVETKYLRASGTDELETLKDLQKKIQETASELEKYIADKS